MRLPAVLFSVLAAALAVVVNTSTLSQPGLSRRVLAISSHVTTSRTLPLKELAKRGSKFSKCLGSCGSKPSTSSPQRTSPAHHTAPAVHASHHGDHPTRSSSSSSSSSPDHHSTRPATSALPSHVIHSPSTSRQASLASTSHRISHSPTSSSSTSPAHPNVPRLPSRPQRIDTRPPSRPLQGTAPRRMPAIRLVPGSPTRRPRTGFGRAHLLTQQQGGGGDRGRSPQRYRGGRSSPAHPGDQLRLGMTHTERVDHDLAAARSRLRNIRTRIDRLPPITSSGSSSASRSRTRSPFGMPARGAARSSTSSVSSGTSFGSKSRHGPSPSTPSSSGSSNDIGRHGSRVVSTPTSYSPTSSSSSSSRSSYKTAPSPLPRLPKGVKGSRTLRIKHDGPHPITGQKASPPTSPGSVGSPSHPSRSSSSGSTIYRPASASSIPQHSSSSSPTSSHRSSPSPERLRHIDKGKAPKLPSSSSSRSSSSSPGWRPPSPSGAGPSGHKPH